MQLHADLRYEDALTEYAHATALDPDDWRWHYYQALLHIERGEAPQAARALRRVVAARPDFGLAWWRLGEAEFKQGNNREADVAYARAEADAAVAGHARRGRARVAGANAPSGRPYTPPRDAMIDALADRSRSSVFLLRQAAAIAMSADPTRREQLVRRALEVDPRNPDVVYEMGALLQQLRRPGDALPYFVRHLDMLEDDQQTLVQIGKCYSDLGRLEEAEATLRRALALGADATGYYNLGFVLERRGRTRDAEESYRRTLSVDPTHAAANNNLAALLAESGRVAEAIEHWRTVLRVDPEHVDAHANIGAALGQAGEYAEALRHLDEALRLNPNHAGARKNREAVLRAAR